MTAGCVSTVYSELHSTGPGAGRVGGLTCVVPSVAVADGGDHEGGALGAERGGHDAQVGRDVAAVEGPGYGQGLVTLRYDAGHLGKCSLVHNVFSKGQRKYFRRY